MKIPGLAATLMATFSVYGAEPAWDQLIKTSQTYLQDTQKSLESEFDISSYQRWDIDQEKGELVFSNSGQPAVVAKIQFVGSISKTSQTWLWSWANSSVLPRLSEQVAEVREYGEKRGMKKLTQSKWAAEESDGWDMAAVTNYLLKGKGVYRPPSGSVFAFVVITDIRLVKQ